jgi:hypothetical protein
LAPDFLAFLAPDFLAGLRALDFLAPPDTEAGAGAAPQGISLDKMLFVFILKHIYEKIKINN